MSRDLLLDAGLSLSLPMRQYDDLGQLFKFGFNPTVGTSAETIWGQTTLYPYPASAEAMTVSSSSAADASAGTGAQTVQVYGLDANYDEQEEVGAMNGQTAVSLGTYIRANRIVVRSAGSGGENDGTVYVGSGTVTAGVPANIYATIEPGENQTLMCLWTVPNGKNFYFKKATISTGGNANTVVTGRLVARPFGEVFQTKGVVLLTRDSGLISIERDVAHMYGPKTDIEVRASASTSTDVSATFEGVTASA